MMKFIAASAIAALALVWLHRDVAAAQSGAPEGATLFEDRFDTGKADAWAIQAGWTVKRDGQNFVLSGAGNGIMQLRVGGDWTDYRLRLRTKILRHGVNVWCRWNGEGAYVVSIGEQGAVLGKQAPLGKAFHNLASQFGRCELGSWHDVEIRVTAANIKFYLDGDLRLDYTDDRPLARGTVSLQTPFDDCQVLIDDVVIISMVQRRATSQAGGETELRKSPGAGGHVPAKQPHAPTSQSHSQPSQTVEPDLKWDILFQDDFDSGNADNWELDTGWRVEREGRNSLLSGSNRTWAKLRTGDDWTDYTLRFRMKIVRGPGAHLNFRMSGGKRYLIGFGEDGAVLRREAPLGTFQDLGGYSGLCRLGTWHPVEIRVRGANIRFVVDGVPRLDATDDRPLAHGSIAFETLEDSRVHFDDIVVVGRSPPRDFSWVKLHGPLGGLGYDVRIDPLNPDVMYVTDNYVGVAKSTDGGNTWTEANQGITARSGPSGDAIPIFCLTIDPHDHRVLWAGAFGTRGIFQSSDGARTWKKKDRGIVEQAGITLRSFTVDPKNPKIVYCGAEIATGEQGLEVERVKGKIYKTLDRGENWTSIWAGDSLVRHIIIDPSDSQIVYAATGIFDREAYNSDVPNGKLGGLGVLKSTDGGRSWSQVNNGLTNLYVGYLAMHPTDRQTLYAATGNYATARKGAASGVFVTHNGALSWSEVLHEDYFPFTAVRVSDADPRIIYAGTEKSIWRSDDGGATWTEFGKPDGTFGPPGVRAGIPIDLTIDPRDPNHVYVNNYVGGVFQSHDGARTWSDSSSGYSGAELRDVAVSPSDRNDVYVVGRSGPFRSLDGGKPWIGIRYPEMYSIVEWYALETAPDDPDKVFATCEGQGIIVRSTNGGRSWKQVFRHPANLGDVNKRHGFKALRFAPSDPNTIYAGMCFRRIHIEFDRRNDQSYGIYVSRDGGTTWHERNHGLQGRSAMNVHEIAVHPTDAGMAYAATNDCGVFLTTDHGETWRPVNHGFVQSPPNLSVRALAVDPRNPKRIYAGVENGGMYVTQDAGTNWSLISAGMAPWASIRSIAINPANSRIVVAGDWHSGVYVTTTGTEPWRSANRGLTTRAVTALAYSRDGSVLYAATDGGGLFRALSNHENGSN